VGGFPAEAFNQRMRVVLLAVRPRYRWLNAWAASKPTIFDLPGEAAHPTGLFDVPGKCHFTPP
jgi:hypothetical protein